MIFNRCHIGCAFTWAGFVCSISFMEAWIKFTAPGVDLSTGLAIGQVVFNALNRVELVFALVIASHACLNWRVVPGIFELVSAVVILLIQTFVLLPAMSARIDLRLSGVTPAPSSLHYWYVSMEVVKVLAIFIYGFKQLKNGNIIINSGSDRR